MSDAAALLLLALLGPLAGRGCRVALEWNHRRWARRFHGSSVEEILGWLE